MLPVRPLCPQQQTFGLGQFQAPTCRRRDGLADTIKVAGIGVVHVALVNERLNHLTGHQNPCNEDAMAATLAVAALLFLNDALAQVRPNRLPRLRRREPREPRGELVYRRD